MFRRSQGMRTPSVIRVMRQHGVFWQQGVMRLHGVIRQHGVMRLHGVMRQHGVIRQNEVMLRFVEQFVNSTEILTQ